MTSPFASLRVSFVPVYIYIQYSKNHAANNMCAAGDILVILLPWYPSSRVPIIRHSPNQKQRTLQSPSTRRIPYGPNRRSHMKTTPGIVWYRSGHSSKPTFAQHMHMSTYNWEFAYSWYPCCSSGFPVATHSDCRVLQSQWWFIAKTLVCGNRLFPQSKKIFLLSGAVNLYDVKATAFCSHMR